MVTIDNIDIGVYIDYAKREAVVGEFTRSIRMREADTIPSQLQVINLFPKMAEMDILLGVTSVTTPWAYFTPPKNFLTQRRSAFSFSMIAPLVTMFEKASALEKKLEDHVSNDEEEEEEKRALLSCLKRVKQLNSWLSFIVGRMGQFLQG